MYRMHLPNLYSGQDNMGKPPHVTPTQQTEARCLRSHLLLQPLVVTEDSKDAALWF